MPLTDEDVLEHFGIKGMRWGVRRTEKQLEAQRARDEASSQDYKTSREARSKVGPNSDTSRLSNQELKILTDRMQLESRFRELASKEDQKYSGKKEKSLVRKAGENLVQETIKNFGMKIIKPYADKGADAVSKKMAKATASLLIKRT